jgi:hypothetical protein
MRVPRLCSASASVAGQFPDAPPGDCPRRGGGVGCLKECGIQHRLGWFNVRSIGGPAEVCLSGSRFRFGARWERRVVLKASPCVLNGR